MFYSVQLGHITRLPSLPISVSPDNGILPCGQLGPHVVAVLKSIAAGAGTVSLIPPNESDARMAYDGTAFGAQRKFLTSINTFPDEAKSEYRNVFRSGETDRQQSTRFSIVPIRLLWPVANS